MIEVTRTRLLGLYACRCTSCDVETYHLDAMSANTEALAHEEIHVLALDLNRWFGLIGASIRYNVRSHFQQLSLS